MIILKKIFKGILIIIGLLVLIIIVALMGESYEIVSGEGVSEKAEVKKVFGRKISKVSINSKGFYHGQGKSWGLFDGRLRQEAQWVDGFWHGRCKTYDENGEVEMIREFEKGRLIRVFVPEGDIFQEVPKNKWPEFYNKIHQDKPVKAKVY